MPYNTDYYKNGKMLQLRPVQEAIHTYKTVDGTLIAIFQGNRGTRPELDFRVKYLNNDPNARPVQLPHMDWVVDLLIKAQQYPDAVKELLDFFIGFYDSCKPFDSVQEREDYEPSTVTRFEEKFGELNVPGTMSFGGVALILELFCLCEKQNTDAHQFKLLLKKTREYMDGTVNYRNLLKLAVDHREY